jgi:mRNA degradation ribonuclease J1/J2
MTVIEYGKDIVVVDCGLIFLLRKCSASTLVIPDMTYLEKNAESFAVF